MFATLAGVSLFAQTVVPFGALAATYSQELQDAYDWAYGKGVTTMSPIDNANMYGAITRAEMAKMLSVYAKEVLGNTPDTSKACTFSDIDSVKWDLHEFIIESCQLGIMGQGITAFRPYDTISRAEFGTALSRVLWGDQYEGGTPYYAKHLDALKAAGIMTQIDNPENRDEIRGYVMLMLMRSEEGSNNPECQDPLVKVACAMDSEECPAACKEGAKDEDGKPIAKGDLAVTADAAPNKKILAKGTSDLDTITFKTSEAVDINKITLERYGYSKAEQVVEVRLEDQDGNVIADAKSLTKDKVTLSLKKGYRTVDGKLEATLVVTTSGAAGSMWFKVTDVDSTAANLNLDDYAPNLYDVVDYQSEDVFVEIKGTDKDYNYEEGKSYEVARIQVKAGNSAIIVKWLTLTNDGNLDMAEFLDELTVTAEGKDVKGLKYNVNKDDELVISFDDVNVDLNKKVVFVISASFKDFDAYGDTIKYYVAETSDINAIEKKNGTRVGLDISAAGKDKAKLHKFAGGKIKLSNTKLGSVNAAQASEDIVVAEWNITITEGISKLSFDVTANNTGVETLTFVVNGDEYEGKRSETTSGVVFSFKNVEIEKSGKAQFLVAIYDDPAVGGSVTFSAFWRDAFSGAKYADANEPVQTADVAGSISFSKVTIQPSKGTLDNKITKAVDFVRNETSEATLVFDGTYTAKKWDIYLNSVIISGANPTDSKNEIQFNITVGEEEVSADLNVEETFDNVLVKAGETVNVKVEVIIDAYGAEENLTGYVLTLKWEDKNGNDESGVASKKLVDMRIKDKGSVTVPADSEWNNAQLVADDVVVAQFIVKPANGANGVTLEDIVLTGTIDDGNGAVDLTKEDITVEVDGSDWDDDVEDAADGIKFSDSEEIPSKGLTVKVKLNEKKAGKVTITLVSVNDKPFGNNYNKYLVNSLVTITKRVWDKDNSQTNFTLAVRNDDDAYSVKNFNMYTSTDCTWDPIKEVADVTDGKSYSVVWWDSSSEVKCVSYDVMEGSTKLQSVKFDKPTYGDYFVVNGSEINVPKA